MRRKSTMTILFITVSLTLLVAAVTKAMSAPADVVDASPSVSPAVSGPEGNYGYGLPGAAVDLGLSVKWSDRNVGANSSQEVGRYFGFGDVEGSETSHYLKRYTSGDITGTDRDPAYVFWGQGWRMPSADEMRELCERCSWKWIRRGGVEGFLVTGRHGNSIFLPVTGLRTNDKYQFTERRGYYWSGDIGESDPNYAHALFFHKGGMSVREYLKVFGFVIRPVNEDL